MPEAPQDAGWQPWAAIASETFEGEEIDLARGRIASTNDTHPSLKQRAEALNVNWLALKDRMPVAAESAGALWFGSQWPRLLETFNKRWHVACHRDWRADSFHLLALKQRLEALDASDLIQRLWCVQALDHFSELSRLANNKCLDVTDAPPGLAFLAWSERLSAQDPGAVSVIEALISKEPAVAWPARTVLWAHPVHHRAVAS